MLCHFMYSLRLCQFYEQLQGGNENEDVARDNCLRYTSCSLFVRISEASAIADYCMLATGFTPVDCLRNSFLCTLCSTSTQSTLFRTYFRTASWVLWYIENYCSVWVPYIIRYITSCLFVHLHEKGAIDVRRLVVKGLITSH